LQQQEELAIKAEEEALGSVPLMQNHAIASSPLR
jgi:hypothetical protein